MLLRYGTLSRLVKCGHYNAEDRYPAPFYRYQRFDIGIIAGSCMVAVSAPTQSVSRGFFVFYARGSDET